MDSDLRMRHPVRLPPAALDLGIWLLVSVVLTAPLSAEDAVTWDTQDVVVDPYVINLAPTVTFHARNHGTSTTHLTDVRASCGCIIPILDQSPLTADPGEAITLPLLVIVEDRPSLTRHEISGMIHGMAETPFHLGLTVYGEPGLSVAPDAIVWSAGDQPLEPGIVHITLPTNDTIEADEPLRYDPQLFQVDVTDVTPAALWDEGWRQHYDLVITPLQRPAHRIAWVDVPVATLRGRRCIRIYTQWK